LKFFVHNFVPDGEKEVKALPPWWILGGSNNKNTNICKAQYVSSYTESEVLNHI